MKLNFSTVLGTILVLGTNFGYAEQRAEKELTIASWFVAAVPNGHVDPIKPLLRKQQLQIPGVGQKYGLDWQEVKPGLNGEITPPSPTLYYAVTEVYLEEGMVAFASADSVLAISANQRFEQPGDVYGSGRFRMPLKVQSGRNLIVVAGLGQRGEAKVRLYKTPNPLVLNPHDATSPDLAVGDASRQWLGVPLLNLSDLNSGTITAEVVESAYFYGTKLRSGPIAPNAASQIGFQLDPKEPWTNEDKGTQIPVTIKLSSQVAGETLTTSMSLNVVGRDANHTRTKYSAIDGSVQYYGVLPPSGPMPPGGYGLILSLHGAGVGATGQSAAYSPKDWAYLIAPTNRREFGFDWEEWGRLDAIETLEIATDLFRLNPNRTHLTGHSMGGHGSWHVGSHFANRFGVIAPSAAWVSFDTYGSSKIPEGVMGRARAASKTLDFVDNLKHNHVYIIHGLDDKTVPASEADTMVEALADIVPQLTYHGEPDQGHWWDLSDEPGADCVDWEPMIGLMEQTTFDAKNPNFEIISAGPTVSGKTSYLTIQSEVTPLENISIASKVNGSHLEITSHNLRSFTIDSDYLLKNGISKVFWGGNEIPLSPVQTWVGPDSGKTKDVHGPINQVFQKPWCFVYESASIYQEYAAYLTSWWAYQGNGRACSVSYNELSAEIKATYGLIYLGIPLADLKLPDSMMITSEDHTITWGGKAFSQVALAVAFPEHQKLSLAIITTKGDEHLLFDYQPFNSRRGKPDVYIWGVKEAGGFFDSEWRYDEALVTSEPHLK